MTERCGRKSRHSLSSENDNNLRRKIEHDTYDAACHLEERKSIACSRHAKHCCSHSLWQWRCYCQHLLSGNLAPTTGGRPAPPQKGKGDGPIRGKRQARSEAKGTSNCNPLSCHPFLKSLWLLSKYQGCIQGTGPDKSPQ